MNCPLKDAMALVTGASSGIGRASAIALARAGARCWLVGRHTDSLRAVADSMHDLPRQPHLVPADLTSDTDCRRIADEIARHGRGLDVLVHSAGAIELGTLEESDPEALDRLYRINLRSPLVLTRLVLPLLRQCRGQVAFINSSAGVNAKARAGHYAATKHALRAIADVLREEVHADGIRVLTIYPGRTATPMQEQVHQFEDRQYQSDALMQPEAVADTLCAALRLPRTAEVTDIHIRHARKLPL